MNVFIYEGKSRSGAKTRIVDGNMQAQVGKEYKVMFNSSILIVAFPNKNQDTEFEFEYWSEEHVETTIVIPEPNLSQNELRLILFSLTFIFFIVCFGSPWYYKKYFLPNLKEKINKDIHD